MFHLIQSEAKASTVVMQRCDWLRVETHLTPGGLSSLNETQWDVMRGSRSVFSFSLKVAVWLEAVSAASWIFNEMAFLIFRPWFLYSSHHKDLRYCWTITNEHTWSQRALLCCLKHYSDTIIFHALWKSLYKSKTDLTQLIDCVSQAVFKVSVCPGLIFPNSQTVPRTFRVMWNCWKTPRIQSVWIMS